MDSYPKFDVCLNLMLSALDIKSSSLARVLNVDTSLVNRWIHGKRVPSYRSHYIECIAEYMSNSILNSYQEKRLDSTLKSINNNLSDSLTLQEKIKKILFEAQGHSIEQKKTKQIGSSKNDNNKQKAANQLISSLLDACKQEYLQESAAAATSETLHHGDISKLNISDSYIMSLSNQDKIILGSRNILYAVLDLLQKAFQTPYDSCDNGETFIYISFNNDIDIFSQNYDLLAQWKSILHALLNKGWKIIFLLRLSHDLSRIIRFIKFMQPLLGTGRFSPHYLKKYNNLSAGKEILAIPGIGALSCFPTKPMSNIECAFYFKNPYATEILSNHLGKVILSSSQPLFRYFPSGKLSEFQDEIAESEKLSGNRYLYRDSFGILTFPLCLYKKYLKTKNLSMEIHIYELGCYKKRMEAFSRNVVQYKYKDIYVKESIERLLNKGQYYFDSCDGRVSFPVSSQDIIKHLSHIVHLLKKFNNYEIALVNEKCTGIQTKLYWMIKEKHSVKLEVRDNECGIPGQNLSLEEPTFVRAFEEYFIELWENIAPINRDRKEIIQWFEEKIRMLKAKKKLPDG